MSGSSVRQEAKAEAEGWDNASLLRGCRVGHSRQGQPAQWRENSQQAGSGDKRKAIAELTVSPEGSWSLRLNAKSRR